MKATHKFLKQAVFGAGLVALVTPAIATPAPTQVAQEPQTSLQTFSSSKLGFRIAFPSSFTIDRTTEAQGTVRLTPAQGGAEQAAQSGQPAQKNETGILISTFANPNGLSAEQWAQQNDAQSFFSGRQSEIRSSRFAGQPAIAYSWCATDCGDSVVFPSRDGKRIVVLSAVYEYPGDPIRWQFQSIAGKFQFAK